MYRPRPDKQSSDGTLPAKAALAMAYVPLQESAEPHYESMEALSRGSLFPGLDLPLLGMVNSTMEACPLTELMAIDFVADELELYLDTHRDDSEAFAMYQTFLALKVEARERYTKLCGPICQQDMIACQSFTWPKDPWPWDYPSKQEG